MTSADRNPARDRRESVAKDAPITDLLREASSPGAGAAHALMPLVYEHLRAVAAGHMGHERRDHSLQPTALVHEAFLKVFAGPKIAWRDREHFFNTMARAMRFILVDHARAALGGNANPGGRGGPRRPFALPDSLSDPSFHADPERIAALDDALTRFEAIDPRAARVVMWRFFNGLTLEEVALASDASLQTVKRDWTFARSWLADALARPTEHTS